MVRDGSDVGSECAIYVRGGEKCYGVGKNRTKILTNLNMNVGKGVIYGLLGASGCGKTTLLSCLVGRRSFESGKVLVFGCQPGSAACGIPGPRVGYMPQELALYGEFTIRETLEYFGQIYNMKKSFVRSQMDFLFKLLDLPTDKRAIKTLSGGQMRRVSFATAIFHDPELMILDEPTVGVDPQLRQNIWDHLVCLSNQHQKTIIITTHYIEEARQAHVVGLMRSGRLLAEESPHMLLRLHASLTLEDVFLKLCVKSTVSEHSVTDQAVAPISNGNGFSNRGVDNPAFSHDARQAATEIHKDDVGHEKDGSLFAANISGIVQCKKNKTFLPEDDSGVVGLSFALSEDNSRQSTMNGVTLNHYSGGAANDMATTGTRNRESNRVTQRNGCSSVGNNADNSSESLAPGGIPDRKNNYNQAMNLPFFTFHRTAALILKNYRQTFRNFGLFLFVFLLPVFQSVMFCFYVGGAPQQLKIAVVNDELQATESKVCNYTTDCSDSVLSCRFLRHLNNETFVQVKYLDFDDAIKATLRGQVWGVVHIPENFTKEYEVRQEDANSATNDTIIGSQIGVNLDWSNQQIAVSMQMRLYKAFEDFSKDVLVACNHEEMAADIALTFLDPIYGKREPSFTEFMAPGVILNAVFFVAVTLTVGFFIRERKEGLFDRNLVAGVKLGEILFAHLINQFTILIGQTLLVFVVMLLVFKIPCNGDIFTGFVLTLLQGLVGMCYGLLISTLCDQEYSAIQMALSMFYPNILLGGAIWPVEGMPIFLRKFSYVLPQTCAINALRSVFARGWGFEHSEVYFGYIASFAWIAFLLGITVIVTRIRKYSG